MAKRQTDKDYIKFINEEPCPLCEECCIECNSIGKEKFYEKYLLDFDEYIIQLLIKYIRKN